MDSKLAQAIQAVLRGGSTEVLMKAASIARDELQAIHDEHTASVAEEHPKLQELVFAERDEVEQRFQEYFSLLVKLQQADRSALSALGEHLGHVQEHLHHELHVLREAIAAERGPYTHSGLNRLLHAQNGAVSEHQEALFEQIESAAQHIQHPEGLLPEEVQWYKDYLKWLESAPQDALPEEAWRRQGGILGEAYFKCDRDFFARRYRLSPTSMYPVNLAINACHLHQQGFFHLSACKWVLGRAFQQLTEIEKAAMKRPNAETPAFQTALDELGEVVALVQDLAEDPKRSDVLPKLVDGVKRYKQALAQAERPAVPG